MTGDNPRRRGPLPRGCPAYGQSWLCVGSHHLASGPVRESLYSSLCHIVTNVNKLTEAVWAAPLS
jgi:hypothetical protein